MAGVEWQNGFAPTIIDRLTDPDSQGTLWRRGYSLDELMKTVHRDVEDLLNCHQPGRQVPAEFIETHSSVIAYGLPDLVSAYGLGPTLPEFVGRAIEETIARFEPRLRSVRAILLTSGDDKTQLKMRYQITAKLRVDPSPEVSFVTVLQLTTGQARIEPDGD